MDVITDIDALVLVRDKLRGIIDIQQDLRLSLVRMRLEKEAEFLGNTLTELSEIYSSVIDIVNFSRRP